ncbi:MAG: hypothetical protein JNL83_39995 [Myxococcales bacterium]|nr:hypothetical protein [Myxococcales bacterium]
MLRTAIATLALLAPALATADPRADLDAAITAAKDGRCREALELARAIAGADRAFYIAHAPTDPHFAACRVAAANQPEQAAPRPPARASSDNTFTTKAVQVGFASGAGALAWLGGAVLGVRLCDAAGCDGGSDPNDDTDEWNGFPTVVLAGGTIATALTATAVVYFAGKDDRHDDSIVTTAVGAAGAGVLGTRIGSALIDRGNIVLGVVAAASVTAAGATIGFHLGRSAKKRGLEIMPAASTSFTGALVGGWF